MNLQTQEFSTVEDFVSYIQENNINIHVFMGGSADPTTWRRDVAEPLFGQASINSFNPQVIGGWSDAFLAIEEAAKDASERLLFVIASQTRGTATMVEAVENIFFPKRLFLTVEDVIGVGTFIMSLTDELERGRRFLRALCKRNSVPHFKTLDEATSAGFINPVILDADNHSLTDLLDLTVSVMENHQSAMVIPTAGQITMTPEEEITLLNAGRQFVRDFAKTKGVFLYQSIEDAVEGVIWDVDQNG